MCLIPFLSYNWRHLPFNPAAVRIDLIATCCSSLQKRHIKQRCYLRLSLLTFSATVKRRHSIASLRFLLKPNSIAVSVLPAAAGKSQPFKSTSWQLETYFCLMFFKLFNDAPFGLTSFGRQVRNDLDAFSLAIHTGLVDISIAPTCSCGNLMRLGQRKENAENSYQAFNGNVEKLFVDIAVEIKSDVVKTQRWTGTLFAGKFAMMSFFKWTCRIQGGVRTSFPNRSGNTLWPIIQHRVHPGTIIMTDSARVYNSLHEASRGGFQHHQVNHRYHFVDPNNPNVHTNTIERTWGLLKGTVHGSMNNERLEMYLGEFIYRRHFFKAITNTDKQASGKYFEVFLQHVREMYPGTQNGGM
ncbi:putative transposase-like protein [Orchesella cincta]|uniref:Putative transposase-like protein n=1 Tax=Orchesella cincta TaxID=48709 RepID=A0A1D2M593_ORCCI|nr:putative transposase-like protein [Orchesella cincta]